MVKLGLVSRRGAFVGGVAIALLAATISSPGETAAAPAPAGDRGGVETGALTAAANAAHAARANEPTPDELARLQAQIPLIAAANRVKAVADTYPAGFTGLALETSSVTLYWKGTVPPEIVRAIDAAKADAPVTIRAASYSKAELHAAAEQLERDTKGKADRGFHSIQIPVDGHAIILEADIGTGDKLAKAKPKTGVTAEIEERSVPTPMSGMSRLSPTANPFSSYPPVMRGGARLDPIGCSVGWTVQKNNTDLLLTAGHCGGNGTSFTDGSGHAIGSVVSSVIFGGDKALIQPTVTVEASISDGGGTFLGEYRPQTNWKLPVATTIASPGYYANQQICQSGMASGTVCGIVVGNYVSTAGNVSMTRTGIGLRGGDSGGPAFAPTFAMQIRSNNEYGRCVDVQTVDNKTTTLFTCNRTPAQQWVYNASDKTVRPASAPTKCLDAASTGNAALVRSMDCNGQSLQKWTPNVAEFGTASTNVQLKNVASGRCLDADTNSASQLFSKLQLWDCTPTASAPQRFTTVAEVLPVGIMVSGTGVTFSSGLNAGYCLDAATETVGNGGKVQMWACTPEAESQLWRIHADGHIQLDGTRAGGKIYCLDADRGPLAGGQTQNVKLQLWECTFPTAANPTAGSNQLFITTNAATMSLAANLGNGACIDANPTGFGNGSQVHLWTCSPVPQQQWNASQRVSMQSVYGTSLGATIKVTD